MALGTVAGALIAAAAYILWAVPRTSRSGVTPSSLARAGAMAWPPVAAASAMSLLATTDTSAMWRAMAAAVVLVVAVWWLLHRWPQAFPSPHALERAGGEPPRTASRGSATAAS